MNKNSIEFIKLSGEFSTLRHSLKYAGSNEKDILSAMLHSYTRVKVFELMVTESDNEDYSRDFMEKHIQEILFMFGEVLNEFMDAKRMVDEHKRDRRTPQG